MRTRLFLFGLIEILIEIMNNALATTSVRAVHTSSSHSVLSGSNVVHLKLYIIQTAFVKKKYLTLGK
jgi:hypothetical protein